VVDYWVDSTLKGFITEITIDTTISYSEAERRFIKGPQSKCWHYDTSVVLDGNSLKDRYR